MDKEIAISLLEKFKKCLIVSQDQEHIKKVIQELDLTLQDLNVNIYEGITLPIRLSEFTNKVNLAFTFEGLRLSEEQSKSWQLLKEAVIKGRQGDRVGLFMLLGIM